MIAMERGADVASWRSGDLGGFFELLARTRGPQIAAAANTLAAPGALPALVHCTAGKDRTGIVVAVVLSALGVGDTDVIHDFALSAAYLDAGFAERTRREMAAAGRAADGVSDRVFSAAEPEWMARVLAFIREHYGDASTYLTVHGVVAGARRASERAHHGADPPDRGGIV